jgi:hypothetical protein
MLQAISRKRPNDMKTRRSQLFFCKKICFFHFPAIYSHHKISAWIVHLLVRKICNPKAQPAVIADDADKNYEAEESGIRRRYPRRLPSQTSSALLRLNVCRFMSHGMEKRLHTKLCGAQAPYSGLKLFDSPDPRESPFPMDF